MDQAIINNGLPNAMEVQNGNEHFLGANTQLTSLQEIRDGHIIPVFVKDNTPAISQVEFIDLVREVVEETTQAMATNLAVRVSHPIKGRTFEARNKPVGQLLEHEKTIYYERMAFVLEFPSISQTIHGQELSLVAAGVKAYNLDNLNNKAGALQHFKFGIGFKVKVCTNLCLYADGTSLNVRVSTLSQLGEEIRKVAECFQKDRQLASLAKLGDYHLTEKQFATIVGKARLHRFLPKEQKQGIPEFIISDSQAGSVARAYYQDGHFCRDPDGCLNLWNLYNLLTGAVKSSYIDSFLDRNVNAFSFCEGIRKALEGEGRYGWFLD